ncbi:histidine kinase dimerization/phosphoacceptor domain -containing protein [Adhaeribacter soli]|uniref:Sensor histidine kinase n=1 Tax=Adhaeribacter soli TaxID=2607655 RepID=A0A5N1IPN5_9BACT|nr:histidine kinase dimerization/phosphoacceptor domain -containing protein [Adhaeribacter soli]KAA9331837.1 sensor histidine kinase [Adhaeribacter soli]
MKLFLRNFLNSVSGSRTLFPLEHRLFNLSSFFITAYAALASIINPIIGLEIENTILSAIGVLISGVLFYIARYRGGFSVYLIFCYVLATITVMGSMYFYNNGMGGTTFYVYIMLLNIFVLVMPPRYHYGVFGILYCSIVGLIALEYFYPEWVVPYHSREEKILDHLTALLFSLLFTVVLIVNSRKSYYRERHKTLLQNAELRALNQQIKQQQAELENAVLLANERRENIETLLNELNHRVKNNLQVVSSLLKLQAQAISDEKAKSAILESKNRLSSMILVHKRLYQNENITKIFMPEYLQELSESVMLTYHGQLDQEMVSYEVDGVWLQVEKAIPVGLISNELITNCFKHTVNEAAGRKISVKLAKTGEQHLLSVSDNGAGFPEVHQSKSFGLELVKSLVTQLNGTYKISFEKGTRWEIYFN